MKTLLVIFLIFPIISIGQIAFVENNKYGFKLNDEVIIQPMYDYASDFTGTVACVKSEGKWGYINRKNKWISGTYDKAQVIMNGFGKVLKDGKYGLVDSLGKEFLPPEYKSVRYSLYDECWYFEKDSTRGLCVGQILVPCIYARVGYNGNGFAYAQMNDKTYDIYNEKGLLLKDQFESFSSWSIKEDNNIVANKDSLYGLYNCEKLKWEIKPKYEYIGNISTNEYGIDSDDSKTYGFVWMLFVSLKDEISWDIDQRTTKINDIKVAKAGSLEIVIENVTGYEADFDWSSGESICKIFIGDEKEIIDLNDLLSK